MPNLDATATSAKRLSSGWTPVAIPHDRELTTLDATRNNGRDDVFVRSEDGPLWVLHGRMPAAEGVKAGDVVSFTPPKLERQPAGPVVGRVEVVESEKNTFQDGFKPALRRALTASAVVGAALVPLTVLGGATLGMTLVQSLARLPFVLGVVGLPATGILVGVAALVGVGFATRADRTDAYDKAR
ncbi:MAG: hypothetical protein VKQ33_12240 [Candidatus Sericytochromatia bacterium]|nr:hypothetical protein [Candidatus Sericytochromatia bacterium]